MISSSMRLRIEPALSSTEMSRSRKSRRLNSAAEMLTEIRRLEGNTPSAFHSARSAATVVEDEVADGPDRPGGLGGRDELRGRDRTAFGVVPAQQRLGACELAGAQVEDRLVVHLELPAGRGQAQVAVEAQVLAVADVDGHVVEPELVAAAVPAGPQRPVRSCNQLRPRVDASSGPGPRRPRRSGAAPGCSWR